MGQENIRRVLSTVALLALPFSFSCKIEEDVLPTGTVGSDAASGDGTVGFTSGSDGVGSPVLTPPIISDPLSGSTVSDPQPMLTVLNSARQGAEQTTYLFQVASDSSFTVLVAQSSQVLEGPDGSTTWMVDRTLSPGTHYWRARARAGTIDSNFSATAALTIGTSASTPGPSPSPSPAAGTVLSDPLIGGTVGEVSGGQFTSGGWQVTHPANYIRYEVPPMESGWVEFDVSGLQEINSSPDQFMLFGMWDPSAGAYRANPYRVHIQKLHPNPHNPPYLRLRWIANGEQHDDGSNFFAWDPRQTYRFRLEWGPSGSSNRVRLYVDGGLEIDVSYNRPYRPNVHFIELGIAERGESVVGAKYSNLRVGK
jgi:hypothetical protein